MSPQNAHTQRTNNRPANNRGTNLSQQDRSRGGRHSAELQQRDARGHFAGKKVADAQNEAATAG